MAVTGALVASADNALVTQLGEKLVAMSQGLPGYVSDGELGDPDAGMPREFRSPLAWSSRLLHRREQQRPSRYPASSSSGAGGEEDFTAGLSGNETVQLDVAVHVPAIAYSGADDPLKVCLEISEALINALRRDDVEDYLNAHRPQPARFTARSACPCGRPRNSRPATPWSNRSRCTSIAPQWIWLRLFPA